MGSSTCVFSVYSSQKSLLPGANIEPFLSRVVESAHWVETFEMCSAVLTNIPPRWPHSLNVNFLSALVATKHKDVSITSTSGPQQ